jgi:hypothetical protein
MGQDSLQEELIGALEHYETSVAAYRQQVEASGRPDHLDQFHTSALTPALEEFERLATRSMDEETDRGLLEQLRQCHKECMAASYELRNPSKSRLAEEYPRLAEKVKALEANCQEVRLALRKHRKDSR